jgi:DNA-binding NtrC family response regulator
MIVETTAANATSPRGARAAATVLLVDDDTAVRNLLMRLLQLHGYQVIAAESGRAALPLWEQHHREIDLLLTDVVMPDGVSGRELAQRCQGEKPALRVIYTSGYNVEITAERGWLRDAIHFLQKPYRPEQLLEAIAEALADAPDPIKESHAANPTC